MPTSIKEKIANKRQIDKEKLPAIASYYIFFNFIEIDLIIQGALHRHNNEAGSLNLSNC